MANFFKRPDYQTYTEDFLNIQSNPLKRSPIMLAILSKDLDTIKAILTLNPEIRQKDRRGNNLLHFAAVCPFRVWSSVLKYCLTKGFFNRLLSDRNKKYVTPIHFICYSKNFENMVSLLKTNLMTIDLLTIEPPYIIKKQQKQQEVTEQLKGQKSKDEITEKTEDSFEESTDKQERTILFTDEMIADLKFEDMIYGGTPLHWCKYKRTLGRLIEYEFNLDAFDLNHETALIKCIKDNRFKCLVNLMNAGANLNLTNKKGNSSLHEAVLSKDIALVQACVCWDAKLDQKNKNGETARHLAACRGTSDDQLIVHILHSVGASRCDKNMSNCKSDCSYNGFTNGKKYSKWPSFERESPFFPFLNQNIIEKKLNEYIGSIDHKDNENKSRKVKMICFDGGGTKGLISVQMLIEIEKLLKRPLNEYFEWMSGTSTGSLIAAMLSLNIPLRNIKVIYYMLKDKIMIGTRPYDSGLLECLLQNILGEDVKMGQLNKKIIITGTLADRKPCQLYLFRSYPSPNEILSLDKPAITELLFGKKGKKTALNKLILIFFLEQIIAKGIDKMKSPNPHSIIIELSNLLTAYQSNSQSKKTQNESVDAENDLKNEQSNFKVEIKKTSKLPSIFNLHSNTTLTEFTESSNETHLHNEVLNSKRLKFYHIPNYLNQKLWLACRSSGAAPTFFRASGPFIDGGIISNNPVLDALTDFVSFNSALKQRDLNESVNELDLVLSIGTGKPPVIPTEVIDIGNLFGLSFLEPYQSALQALNLAQEIVTMATQTDAHVVQRGQAWCNSIDVPYFRFNPPLSIEQN